MASLREHCRLAITADGFPKMQDLGEKMLHDLPLEGLLGVHGVYVCMCVCDVPLSPIGAVQGVRHTSSQARAEGNTRGCGAVQAIVACLASFSVAYGQVWVHCSQYIDYIV